MGTKKQTLEPPSATRLLLIRHGEVEIAHQHTFGGRLDMNLSERGHGQAEVLAHYLQGRPLDALYASPMKRVQQTLAPFLKNGAPPQTILPALREVDFGDWTGLGWAAVTDRFGFGAHEWLDQLENHGAPHGESGQTFRARIEPCVREIIKRHPEQTVAIFCHGGVIRMILSILLDLPLPKTNQFEIEYTSVTQLALYSYMNEVELLNFTPWRDWKR